MPRVDLSSALLIGIAVLLLLSRIVIAFSKARAVKAARECHYVQTEESYFSLATMAAAAERVPRRLRYGLLFGGIASLLGALGTAAPTVLQPFDAVPRALWTSAKWLLIAGVVSFIRAQGMAWLRGGLARGEAR